ncbi:MAG: hypothetical protein ACR2PW_04195 [Gammaproteobacteria bacterium]
MGRNSNASSDYDRNSTPLIEIFGGLFALLLVLFLIFNLFSQAAIQERIETAADEGLFKIGWGAHGAGFVIITLPDELRIVETGSNIVRGKICHPQSPFVKYVLKVYNGERQQIIFTLLEGSVGTMAEARNCIMKLLPNQRVAIGWIIADREVLKSVSLNDIPPYIEKVIKP